MTTQHPHADTTESNTSGLKTIKGIGTKVSESITETHKEASADVERLEKKIRDNPIQSVGLAFAAGLLVSYLLKRR